MEYVPFLRFHADTRQIALVVGMVMLVAGLVILLYGWKLYRLLLVISFGLAAGYVGWYFLTPRVNEKTALLVSIGVGLLGALVAIPVQKAVVFLLGATVGFVSLGPVAADLIWRAPNGPTPTQYLIIGAVAFIVMGVFALLLFRPAMIVATSMLGATFVLSATVQLVETFSSHHQNIYSRYPDVMAWAYVALIIFGVIFQAALVRKDEESD